MKVMKEETFGPLLPIMPFDTDDEAVKLANDTVYGLECQQGNKRGKTEVPDFQGDVGMSGSMAEDSGRKIHISYIDGTNYRLKYATDANGLWASETLDTGTEVGAYTDTSIAVDTVNKSVRVHISYYDQTKNDLKYAVREAGSWTYYSIDTADDAGCLLLVSHCFRFLPIFLIPLLQVFSLSLQNAITQ
jgi:hypothetical protein